MTSTRHALALDDAMQDPQFADLVAWCRRHAPVGWLDQQDAATNHAHTLMHAFHTINGGSMDARTSAEMPTWVRLSALQAWVQLQDGTADTCLHAPPGDRPQPVITAAWKPGLIVCQQCTRLLSARRGSVEDRTCDGCGHLCDTANGDMIHPCGVQLGVLLFQFGLCRPCRDDMLARQAAP